MYDYFHRRVIEYIGLNRIHEYDSGKIDELLKTKNLQKQKNILKV